MAFRSFSTAASLTMGTTDLTTTTARPKAYSYTRFSTPEQLKGDSLRRQTALAEQYAKEHDLDLDTELTFRDLGVSAYRGANVQTGALRTFLRAVEDGVIPGGSYLLVESLDRISRADVLDAQATFMQIVNAGITLVTLMDRRAYSRESLIANPTDLIVSIVMMMRANEESATKAKRIRASWDARRARAPEGRGPLSVQGPLWLTYDRETNTFIPNEERVAVVRRIFDEALKGYGQNRIAKGLNVDGVPTFGRAVHWHGATVRKILNSPAAMGTLLPYTIEYTGGRRSRTPLEPVPGAFPAAVSADVWNEAQTILNNTRAPLRGRHASTPLTNILGGLCLCPGCGGSFVRASTGRGGRYVYLACARAKAGVGPCKYRTVRYDAIEAAVLHHLPERLDVVPAGDVGTELDDRIRSREAELDVLREQLRELVDALTAEPRSRAIRTRIVELETAYATLEAEQKADVELRERTSSALVAGRVERLKAALRSDPLDVAEANVQLRSVFTGAVVNWPEGLLEFRWAHGGEAVAVPFAWPQEVPLATSR